MGMFDYFHDKDRNDWQTKAYGCALQGWDIGDSLPEFPHENYQVEVLGSVGDDFAYSFATVTGGRLADVPCERDASLPFYDYFGDLVADGEGVA